eukprot:3266844-Rhodomonas_salina.4
MIRLVVGPDQRGVGFSQEEGQLGRSVARLPGERCAEEATTKQDNPSQTTSSGTSQVLCPSGQERVDHAREETGGTVSTWGQPSGSVTCLCIQRTFSMSYRSSFWQPPVFQHPRPQKDKRGPCDHE